MGQAVVVATKKATDKFNMLKLNATACDIWDEIAAGKSEDAIAEAIMAKYEVSKEDAAEDVREFVGELRSLGIIDED